MSNLKDQSARRFGKKDSPGAWLRGQSTVELGLLVPVVMFLLVASGDFGRIFFARMELIGAARAGAAYGAQNRITAGDYNTMKTTATSAAPDVSGTTATATSFCTCLSSGASITCTSPGSCTEVQVYVQVDTYATFKTLLNYPGIPNSVSLHSTAVLPVY